MRSSADGIQFDDICSKFMMLVMQLQRWKRQQISLMNLVNFIGNNYPSQAIGSTYEWIATYRTTHITFSRGVLYAEMYAICCWANGHGASIKNAVGIRSALCDGDMMRANFRMCSCKTLMRKMELRFGMQRYVLTNS